MPSRVIGSEWFIDQIIANDVRISSTAGCNLLPIENIGTPWNQGQYYLQLFVAKLLDHRGKFCRHIFVILISVSPTII